MRRDVIINIAPYSVDRDNRTITIDRDGVESKENRFVAMRDLSGTYAHLLTHLGGIDKCDEDGANPDLAQAIKFDKARASIQASFTKREYEELNSIIDGILGRKTA